MDVGGIPIFQMIRGRLGWLTERQRVIAENVANADTPGYGARDIRQPASFDAAMRAQPSAVTLARTRAGHIAPQGNTVARYEATRSPDSETTQDGNSVVVEEQMLKMAESRMAYDAAISLYQKSLNMIRTAARPPGR